MPNDPDPAVDHGLLAWHLLMERARYQGKDFRGEMIKAFNEVARSLVDTKILDDLRRELNLET